MIHYFFAAAAFLSLTVVGAGLYLMYKMAKDMKDLQNNPFNK
jgi:hypothetical protein